MSHYWDCRLKGRPPGTPKSDDPNKKKRKRQARERDLCDVKIKITEYFPGARAQLGDDMPGSSANNRGNEHNFFPPGHPGPMMQHSPQSQSFATANSIGNYGPDPLGSEGSRFYTIQRVNGNGANGKSDGVAGSHKHSLEDSDRVKKNSILRQLQKEQKVMKKSEVSIFLSRCGSVDCIIFRAQSSKTQRNHAYRASQASLGTCNRRIFYEAVEGHAQ